MVIRIFALLLLCMAMAGCSEALEGVSNISERVRLQALSQEAARLHDDGQTQQAIDKFETIVQSPQATNSQKADALRVISLGYYELGDYQRSGEYAAKAAALYPKGSYEYLVNMADADLMQDRVPEAIVRLEQALLLGPRKVSVNNVLGLVYLGDNGAEYADYRKALTYNQVAQELAPGRITAIALARNYLYLEEYAQARDLLGGLSERHREDAEVQALLQEAQAGLDQAGE